MVEPSEAGPTPPGGAGADDVDVSPDAPTVALPAVATEQEATAMHVRLFGSTAFFRLWLTQVVSATGDWLGFLAIAALATRVGAGSPEAAVGVVMSARIVPGFFLGPAAGVFADRFDRKRLMMACDIGRALVLASLPFVDTVGGLVVASLVMEVFTLLWAPAKEASVPHIVPAHHLTTANSLSLVAAYGTIPVAAGLFSLLAKISETVGDFQFLAVVRGTQEGLAFYVDAGTFALSAIMISTLPLPRRRKQDRVVAASKKRIEIGSALTELKEGWQFVFINPVVRAVNLGLATGLVGGGMLVPLGPVFATDIVGAGQSGFGLLILALGMGVASGVVAVSVLQRKLPKEWVFVAAVFVAGASLMAAASMSTLGSSALFVFVLGVCAGTVYVLGFTLLHEHVDDDLRGRIFSALYTLVRMCVLIAFAVGPFLAEVLDRLSDNLFDGAVGIGSISIAIPGVRLTLWTAGLIIIGAGFIATSSMRDAARRDLVESPRSASPDSGDPGDPDDAGDDTGEPAPT